MPMKTRIHLLHPPPDLEIKKSNNYTQTIWNNYKLY